MISDDTFCVLIPVEVISYCVTVNKNMLKWFCLAGFKVDYPQSVKDYFYGICVMIGANILPAVATDLNKDNISKGSRYVNPGYCCDSTNENRSSFGSIHCQKNTFQSIQPYSSPNKEISCNPGSYLLPIWWNECICGWSKFKSSSLIGEEKWQVTYKISTVYLRCIPKYKIVHKWIQNSCTIRMYCTN